MSSAPLHHAGPRRLLTAYAANQLGDWAGEIALAVVVFASTGSAAAVAATWVVQRSVLSLTAPALVARLEHRRRALVCLLGLQAAVYLALASTAHLGLAAILPLAALDGVLAPAARALARAKLIAAAKPLGLLRETNALVTRVFTVNAVAAPALGGLLLVVVSPAAVFVLDALTFAAAAVLVAPVRDRVAAERAPRGVAAALRHVLGDRVLCTLVVGDAALVTCLAAVTPVEVAFVTDTLGGGSDALGLVLAAWGAGMVLGGLAAARLPREADAPVIAVASAVPAAAFLAMAFAADLPSVVALCVVGGAGNGAAALPLMTRVQEITAEAFQARVAALCETLQSVGPGLGFALGGAVATLASPRAAYVLAGAGGLAVVVLAVARLSALPRLGERVRAMT